MPTFWQQWIDVILPPAPESKLVREETPATFQTHYQPRWREHTLLLSQYRNESVQAAINANKFYGDRHASALLASLLRAYLDYVLHTESEPIQIIPIPLSSARAKDRGYNQVSLILSALNQTHPNKTKIVPALKRPLHTQPQSHLKREQRIKNVQNAFKHTRYAAKLDSARPIWILDDVSTTGATLKAAKSALPHSLRRSQHIQTVAIAG